jgi:hypothetical protein
MQFLMKCKLETYRLIPHAQSMSKDQKKPANESGGQFDMYHLFSRWDVLLAVAFVIGFLIFTMALFLYPQAV